MRIAVITGASSGMGREFVRQIPHFYQGLDELWVIARRKERLTALKSICPIPIRIFAGDLTEEEFYIGLKAQLSKLRPDIRMLVNAAGFGKTGTVEDIYAKESGAQEKMIWLNCNALTKMIFMCMPYLSKGSRILNLSSAAAFCPQPRFAVYAASKSYVLSFSRALSGEWKRKGIYVTAVCPGPVDTEFFEVMGKPSNPLKKLVMADAPSVVRQALLDSRKKKTVSIYGGWMKAIRILMKLLPKEWVIRIESIGIK